MARPKITSTLAGARTVAQFESNIAAATIRLTNDQMTRLNDASTPTPGFSASLMQPMIRRMVFGGQSVTGWGESG